MVTLFIEYLYSMLCLAAVAALERGRQGLYAARPGPRRAVPARCVSRVGALVVSDFYARLRDFVNLGIVPRGWSMVGADHPLLAASVGGGLVLRAPPAVVWVGAGSDSDSDSDCDVAEGIGSGA